ncbi:MAG: hypothetical protein AAFO73_09785 [Pseudomonadota bacterium]
MLKYLHALAYSGLSATYVGKCIGFDKTALSITMAVIYLALAVASIIKKGDGADH